MRYYEIINEYLDLNKTLFVWGDKLQQRNMSDHNKYPPKEIINKIIDSDPTKNQQYSLWIIQTYINKGINYLEDLSRVYNALILFNKFKNKLPINQRDIQKIKKLSELENLVDQFKETKTGKEVKQNISDEIKKQTKIIYNGQEGKILIPLTEESSCFWGKNTRWCTASTETENLFNDYNKDGPLYIILPNDNTKWQFHFQSAQLMNEQDEEIDFNKFNKKYPWVFKNIKFSEEDQLDAVNNDSDSIEFIKNPSEKVQLAAVKQDGLAIEFIKNPSEKVQLAVVNQNGSLICYIKKPSEKVQLAAVNKNGRAVQYIIAKGLTPSEEVQLAAVNQDGWSIQYIKNPSEEIQLAAVKQDGNAIYYINNPSEEVQLAAVKQYGRAIRFINNPSEKVKQAAKR